MVTNTGYKPEMEQEIVKIYSEVQRKILLFGETILSEASCKAFRRLVIEEFGYGGAKDKVHALFTSQEVKS